MPIRPDQRFPSQPASGGHSLVFWRRWQAATPPRAYRDGQRRRQAVARTHGLGCHHTSRVLPSLHQRWCHCRGAFAHSAPSLGGAAQTLGSTAQTAAQTVAPTLARICVDRPIDPKRKRRNRRRRLAGRGNCSRVRGGYQRRCGTRSGTRASGAGVGKGPDISVDQARSQVAEFDQQYRQFVDQAKRQATAAADATATAVSRGALFGAIALIFGALAGWFGGRMGALDTSEVSTSLRRRHLN
jgi:hypothetical protein